MLVFRQGTWTPEALPQPPPPAATNFVERPAKQPAYSIIAAAIIPKREPVYGGLAVVDMSDGSLLVTFNGYATPDGTFQYVVKAMPVVDQQLDHLYGTVITFNRFDERGVALRVINQGRFVSAADMQRLEFMIEVSRFEARRF